MSTNDVVLCHPVRTAIGTYGGTLKDVAAPDLGAAVIGESLQRAGLAPDKVQSVIMGNVIQAGVKMNAARQAGIEGVRNLAYRGRPTKSAQIRVRFDS